MGTARSKKSDSSHELGRGYVVDYEPRSPGAGGLGQAVHSGTENGSGNEYWTSASQGYTDEESDGWDGDGEDNSEE